MSYKVIFKIARASLTLLLIGAVLLSGCTSSSPIYPGAQAYDKQVHGLDKGTSALLICTNLPPLHIRKHVKLQIQSYVTHDSIESVKSWYANKLSDWEKLSSAYTAKMEKCPNGVSYVFPKQCKSGDCTKQMYILEEASDEIWIVLVTLK